MAPVDSQEGESGGQLTPSDTPTSPTPAEGGKDAATSPDPPAAPAAPTESLTPSLKEPPVVPMLAEARKCNLEQFVNRFSPEEGGYAIEYLESGVQLGGEMATEVTRRRLSKVKGYEDRNANEYRARRFDGGLSNRTWIRAVRIQSPTVLKTLADITNYNWGTEPPTFMRPFGQLIHFHPKIKARLEELRKAKAAKGETKGGLPSTSPGADGPDELNLEHLERYVSFVESKILPPATQFQDASSSNVEKRRVRFEDMHYLFQPGDLVYVPLSTFEKRWDRKLPKDTVYQKIWRIENFRPHLGDLDLAMHGYLTDKNRAMINAHFVDHDGSNYKLVSLSFDIDYFDGEKDIRTLTMYPIRFAADSEKLLSESRELGSKFTQCISQRHVSYKAWTLVSDGLGRHANENAKGSPVTSPDFIDGDVIIDFQESFNAQPRWKFAHYGLVSSKWSSDVTISRDKFPILLWDGPSRTELKYEWPNAVVCDDDIDYIDATAFQKKDPYGTVGLDEPRPEDLVLLPRRLCGYGLRERKFIYLDVDKAKVGREKIDAFSYLQIDAGNNEMIRCLLEDHFATKQARKMAQRDIPGQDPIPGKGRSLVFLLHGPPGVGKTATVEAVALEYEKPLFSITSGDLGSTPDAVESSLTEIFHLANVWDCVLLLDEADVFLEEREKSNLKRNAVVSVFLRVLEYYSGVLFLTTNRPGQLDEAIKSRVHCALLYRTLDLDQTLKVFRTNIQQLKLIQSRLDQAAADTGQPPRQRIQPDEPGILAFAEKHWGTHDSDERGRWNGRQIRNAFVSAAALARREKTSAGDQAVVVLTERHFQRIAKTVTSFDRHMAYTRRQLDSERAHTRFDRSDDYTALDDLAAPPGGGSTSRHRRSSSRQRAAAPSSLHLTPTRSTTPRHSYSQIAAAPPSSPPYYLAHAPQAAAPLNFQPAQPSFTGTFPYPLQLATLHSPTPPAGDNGPTQQQLQQQMQLLQQQQHILQQRQQTQQQQGQAQQQQAQQHQQPQQQQQFPGLFQQSSTASMAGSETSLAGVSLGMSGGGDVF
ncbi:hypothetical protein C8A05DRAFT_43158 [Staphylotrichum tortipilum]|uniref:AAA+ ATPase domain-containing protein n=1 Tax=Staphylotrichum tortipilum TaxID=2831512 RepID=A0AAN6RUW4_9PEZI|nr:hypothetical protein C8A05DRAFT_43158 [Staphylotrichum longicolle]